MLLNYFDFEENLITQIDHLIITSITIINDRCILNRIRFIVKFLNITESSDFVGFDPINFTYWKALGKNK